MANSDFDKSEKQKPDREHLFNGAVWSTGERIATQGVTFIVTLALARLLTPADFGMIGMIAIFIDLGVIIGISGLSQALIRNSGGTDEEATGVVVYNLISGCLLYAIIWFCAPYIANFYSLPALITLIRVVALVVPIRSLSTVALARISARLDFLRIAIVSLASLVASGALGIYAAIRGMGVYAIVTFQIGNALLYTVLLWLATPSIRLSKFRLSTLQSLINFGKHLSAAAVADLLYNNAYLIAIGKLFPVSDVGYFSRGRQFASVPPISIGEIIRKVAYPILCRYESDIKMLSEEGMKILRVAMFVTLPMMMAIAMNAEPLIATLLGEKWRFAATLLSILCFGSVWIPIDVLNMTMLPAAGRPDLLFKLELARKGIGIITLLCSLPFGLKGICYGYVIGAIIALILTLAVSKRIFGISFRKQSTAVIRFIIPTIVAVCGAYYYSTFVSIVWVKALIGIGGAAAVYLSIARLFSFPELITITKGLKRFFSKE